MNKQSKKGNDSESSKTVKNLKKTEAMNEERKKSMEKDSEKSKTEKNEKKIEAEDKQRQ